jgi:hypothetical protein
LTYQFAIHPAQTIAVCIELQVNSPHPFGRKPYGVDIIAISIYTQTPHRKEDEKGNEDFKHHQKIALFLLPDQFKNMVQHKKRLEG